MNYATIVGIKSLIVGISLWRDCAGYSRKTLALDSFFKYFCCVQQIFVNKLIYDALITKISRKIFPLYYYSGIVHTLAPIKHILRL